MDISLYHNGNVLHGSNMHAILLYDKYKQTEDIRYLEGAIEATRRLVQRAGGGRFHAACLNDLGVLLLNRFQRTGVDTDLEESFKITTRALELTPTDDDSWPCITINLVAKLRLRSYKTSEVDDIERGIQLCKKGLYLVSQVSELRQPLLSLLASMLGMLYLRRPDLKDLKEAIRVSREALTLARERSDSKASEYNNLGNRLAKLYGTTGDPAHLKEAIQCAREAVRCTVDEMNRPSRLANLGKVLTFRYERTMNLDDLNDAVECLTQVVMSPLHINDMDWPQYADRLAKSLFFRYERIGDQNDFDECLRFQRQAITHKTLNANDPNRRSLVGNLGFFLARSYENGGQIEDLEHAMKYNREAVKLAEVSGNSNLRWDLSRRYNLGITCYYTYLSTGSKSSELLKEAFENVRSATSSMQEDFPDKAISLMALGTICETSGDVDEALECFIHAFENVFALPIIRVWSARKALRIHQNTGAWDKAISLARNASKLLPLVCSRYLSLRDQQHAIAQVSGFAADVGSICLMIGRPEEALQQLEIGRGLILSYRVDGNSEIFNMKEDARAFTLVKRYENLRDQLTQVPGEDMLLGRKDRLVDEIEACAEDIRNSTKFKRFLLGPEIEELTRAATDCPIVVVNSTTIASHAIITWEGRVTSLPLEQLSIGTAPESVQKRLGRYEHAIRGNFHRRDGRDVYAVEDDDDDFLSWLWNSCVRLVLCKLESLGLPLNGKHRVWWIGTGIAGSFPFHAAGIHSSQPTECTLMKVISSYATSIKTLAFSMSRKFEKTHIEGSKRLLFVGMPTTPGGQRPLPGVLEEESVIRKACGDEYEFEVRRNPTASEILDKITESDVVHFACHGSSNPTVPSESHLLLQKRDESGLVVDRLTVENLSKIKAKDRCFIAFLSACSTAEVKANSSLADEAIHLTSILQAAGFAHTIGTLWPASDEACVQVSKEFYTRLFQDEGSDISSDKIARALHSAVRFLKSTAEGRETWMPFVHYGA